MAPTEETILNNYLLIPSQLPAIISLKDFTALFPKSQQASPQIRALYRDFQRQRAAVADVVAANVEGEVKRGKALRREAARARKESELQDADDEIQIERALAGPAPNAGDSKLNLSSVIPSLESAAEQLQSELGRLQHEEAELLHFAEQTVGSMSDLRYGRLANSKLRGQILEGLQNFQDTCEGES